MKITGKPILACDYVPCPRRFVPGPRNRDLIADQPSDLHRTSLLLDLAEKRGWSVLAAEPGYHCCPNHRPYFESMMDERACQLARVIGDLGRQVF